MLPGICSSTSKQTSSKQTSNVPNAILSGSGVLSLGTGTHNFGQSNRTFIDGPGNRMSIGSNFKYESNVLKVGGWSIGDSNINFNQSSTERIRIDANSGNLQIDGDDALGILIGNNVGGGVALESNTSIPIILNQIFLVNLSIILKK